MGAMPRPCNYYLGLKVPYHLNKMVRLENFSIPWIEGAFIKRNEAITLIEMQEPRLILTFKICYFPAHEQLNVFDLIAGNL